MALALVCISGQPSIPDPAVCASQVWNYKCEPKALLQVELLVIADNKV